MSDDIDMYIQPDGCYLESLIKSRCHLVDSAALLVKLDEVIDLELKLAILGAEKAISLILKANKSTVSPLKGV